MDPTTLDYGSRDTPEPRRPPSVVAVVVLTGLTVVAVTTCARIEWLNARAGFYLPRAATDGGRWLTVPGTDEAFRLSEAAFDPTLASRPLSPEERRAVRRWAARNQLRDVVGTWGLGQYLVVPAVLALSASMLRRRPTLTAFAFAALCSALGVVCGVAMLYRAYFTSLGPG